MKNPVGPEAKKVYLRRRLVFLGVLLAVVAVVLLIVFRPGSVSDRNASPEVSLPGDVVEKPEPSETKAAGPAACAQGALEVTALTNATQYAPSEQPEFSLQVKNTGPDECTLDAGTAGMTFTVTSGSEQYWSSVDCQTEGDTRPVIVKPGKSLSTETIAWDRTRSAEDTCEIEREPVPAGGASYHLRVALAGVESDTSAQFILN